MEKKGRVLALIIACALLLPNLASIVLLALAGSPLLNGFMLLQVAITCAISWCLFRGRNWARWYVVFTAPIACLYVGVKVMAASGTLGLISVTPFLIVLIGSALVLWRSPTIAAYFEREVPDKRTVLSMKDDGGV
jgi:hypothetical protein